MTGQVWFNENGSEYTGYFHFLGVRTVSFDPAQPRVVFLDKIRIELDE